VCWCWWWWPPDWPAPPLLRLPSGRLCPGEGELSGEEVKEDTYHYTKNVYLVRRRNFFITKK
jgi:hypothetical protein